MNAYTILLVLVWVVVDAAEPECSSFHFVEKTLEKTIKTEIFVNQMKSDIDDKQDSMTKTLNGIQSDWEKMKIDLQTEKEENRKTVEEMKETYPDHSQMNAVAFMAYNIKNTNPSVNETMIFTTTIFDRGSGYNDKTGVYVTPVSGVYVFNLQLCLNTNKYFYFEISSEKAPILKSIFFDDGSNYRGCQTATAIAVLGAKESVWISSKGSSTGADLWEATSAWNSFSGVLVASIP